MAFTDDRLRILKNIELKQTAPIQLTHTEIESLLARLEAAEKALRWTDALLAKIIRYGIKSGEDSAVLRVREEIEAWFQSKVGK